MIVFIGSTAEALKDIRTTPLAPVIPGVEIHAQVIEQILAQDFLHRPDWFQAAETLAFVVLGIILIVAIRYVGALWSLLIALVAGAGAIAVSWYGFTRFDYLIDPLFPCLVILLVYLSSSLLAYLQDGTRKAVRAECLQPLSLAGAGRRGEPASGSSAARRRDARSDDPVLRHPRLHPHRRAARPAGADRALNRFLTPLTRVIQPSGGSIDKYMGDCIMAFWNAPLDVPGHGGKALPRRWRCGPNWSA